PHTGQGHAFFSSLLDRRRRAEHLARSTVAPQHGGVQCGERSPAMTETTVRPASELDAHDVLALYEQMQLIRRTERAAHDLFMSGLVKGTTHLAAGQEAVAVGASAALRPDDYVFATYRGHHQDRKSTRLNSSHVKISYAVFC